MPVINPARPRERQQSASEGTTTERVRENNNGARPKTNKYRKKKGIHHERTKVYKDTGSL